MAAELWLLTAVRLLGVFIGVWGAWLVSPGAAREVGRALARWARRIYRAFGRKRRQPAVHSASGSIHGTVAVTGRVEAVRWSEDPSRQIQILKARTEALSAEISELRREHGDLIEGLDQRLDDVMNKHVAALGRLNKRLKCQDRQALRINARGLPLIGTSIVLTGLPDPWAGHAWLGGFLLVGGFVVWLAVVLSGHRGVEAET